ncbi:MAG: DUF4340 domain-containing protein [Firmicutes bacterium]|nr:DUF4340 domain-containing protein [Bacillota bacterium]
MAEYKEGMSGAKKLIILLVILALLLGLFFGVRAWNKHQEEADRGTQVLSFEPADVTSFRYTLDGVEYSFTRGKDGGWSYDQDPSGTPDSDKVDNMLQAAGDVYAETIVSDNLDELAKYGLEKPVFTLDLTLKDGSEHGLYEGSVNSMNGVTYACMKGESQIVALASSVSGSFLPASDLMEAAAQENLSE